MLTRAAAIEAIAGQHFEVVVIGGGITGAGVALDAASRGYSVALLERGDYAVGTSSRSSKMVHGGLRYLQNFDLGLVREALLERQLMVQLAPHLVYPTPFLVAAPSARSAATANSALGLNMYDVMATTRVGRSRREMRSSKEEDEDFYWSPDRHRTIDRDEVLELVPALAAARPQRRLPLLRLPDRRRAAGADDPRRGRALRRGDAERGRGDRGPLRRTAAPPASPSSRPSRASASRSSADNVVNATGVLADQIRPEERRARRTCRGSRPAAAPTCCSTASDLPMGERRLHRPGRRGPDDLRPALVRAHPGRHHRQRLRRRHRRTRSPAEDDVEYLLDAVNDFFGIALERVRPGRRLRRRAAADLHRRPAQVGRHLAQGGALRDLLGDADDHRRQAHHLAADGEADGRPPGRARGPRGALPHGRDPARDGGARRRTWRRPRGWGRRRSPSSPSATATPPATCSSSPARTRSWRAPIVPGRPDLLAEVVVAARLEQARCVADVLLRRTRLGLLAAPQLRDAEAARPVAEALGGELGWSRRQVKQEAEAWPTAVAGRGRRPRRRARGWPVE